MKRILIFLILVTISILSWAQDPEKGVFVRFVDYHSPEVQAMTRYSDIPVGHFTGTPQIEIPLYNIDISGFKLNGSISYHASGIKVDDIASCVGLGWVMNAGGVISRTVNGLADESANGFLNRTLTSEELSADITLKYMYNTRLGEAIDCAADNFTYNFIGYTGKFSFGVDKKVHQTPFNDLKFEFVDQSYFKVKTPEGHVFIFNDKESTTIDNSSISAISAWHLSKIILNNNQGEIDFTYIQAAPYNDRLINFSSTHLISRNVKIYPNYANYIKDINTNLDAVSYSYIFTGMKYLKEIKLPSTGSIGRILFDYDDAIRREDFLSGKIMRSVKVYNSATSTIPIKQWELSQIFILGDDGYKSIYHDGQDRYRMYLTGITEKSSSENKKNQIYTMEYSPILLPCRKSFNKDLWGFYNGRKGNSSTLYIRESDKLRFNTLKLPFTSSNNRLSDENYIQAGILKKIIYPTGGYTAFNYEPHQFSKQIAVPSTAVVEVRANQDDQPNDPYRVKEFVADVTLNATLRLNIPPSTSGMTCYAIFEDLTVPSSYRFTTYPEEPKIRTMPMPIVAGHKYRLTAFITIIGYDDDKSVSMNLSWPSTGIKKETSNEGGLRIKDIKNYSNGNLIRTRSFKYGLNEDGEARMGFFDYGNNLKIEEGGAMFSEPTGLGTSADIIYTHRIYTLTSQPYYNTYIGYESVTEYVGESYNTIGKTEYFYDFKMDDMADSDEGIPTPALQISNSWQNGNPREVRIYKKEPDGYNMIQKTKNTYTSFTLSNSMSHCVVNRFLYTGRRFLINNAEFNYCNEQEYEAKRIPISAEIKKLTKSEKTDYIYTGIKKDSLLTITEYTYDGLNRTTNPHSFLSKTKETNSNAKVLETESKYLTDIATISSNTHPVYKAMYDRNIIGTPLQTVKKVDGKVTMANVILFRQDPGTANTILVPSEQKVLFSTAPLADYKNLLITSVETVDSRMIIDIKYDKFDKQGNLNQYTGKDGLPIVILWSHNSQNAIAEIKNASYSQVTGFINETTLNAIAAKDAPSASDIDLINSLRSKLPDAHISTYTYKPLVGILTATDSSGITTYYDYDAFGRLKETYIYKDNIIAPANKQTVQEYDYHYQNQ